MSRGTDQATRYFKAGVDLVKDLSPDAAAKILAAFIMACALIDLGDQAHCGIALQIQNGMLKDKA